MALAPELLHDNGEWSVAEKWVDENATWIFSPDANESYMVVGETFQIVLLMIGSSVQMEFKLSKILFIKHTTKIRKALLRYLKRQDIDYLEYRWLYASPDMKQVYPLEEDSPESLGLPRNGCAVIPSILGRDYREKRYDSGPIPVAYGKMPRARKQLVMPRGTKQLVVRHVPYRRASARASASCAILLYLRGARSCLDLCVRLSLLNERTLNESLVLSTLLCLALP